MQKEFINIASHKIRTPIQAVVGYIHTYWKKYPEKKDEILEVLKRNGTDFKD